MQDVSHTEPRPSRLLLLTDTLEGGMGASVRSEARWFAAHGWQVAIAAPGQSTAVAGGDLISIEVPSTARHLTKMFRAAADLRRFTRSWRPSVVHAHGMRAYGVALLSLAGRAYVTLHGTGPNPVDPRGFRIVRSIAVATIPLLSRRAMTVAPLGWPFWLHVPHASPALADLDVFPFPEGQTPTFLWVGALDRRKQPELFVEAIRIAAESVDVRGVMAGSGPRFEEIARLVSASGARIELVGHTADLRPLLARSWAVVLLSLHEGVPFALEEAMWAGRAVIAPPHPGIEWLAGPTARYASTAAEAAAAMIELSDPTVASREGEQAAARVRQQLDATDPWPRLSTWFGARKT